MINMVKTSDIVLSHIQDELSKEVYRSRIAFNNGSMEALEKIIPAGGDNLIEFMNTHYEHLYIFGAGILGSVFVRMWGWKYSFRGFIDNDEKKHGKRIDGISVAGLKETIEKSGKEIAVIVVNKLFYEEIRKQLCSENINNKNIFILGELYSELKRAQYFDLKELDKNIRERFVDCGALDGTTSTNMYEWYRGHVDKIWLFEPDAQSVQKCRANMEKIKFQNYEVIEKAVYSMKTQLHFHSLGTGSSAINPEGKMIVNTISLDEAIGEEKPTFIKMDIEGAELEALKGAKEIIQRDRPKLAICVYHKPEDINAIPELLLEYNSDYKFYFRHYSVADNETVLYAL